MIELTSPIIGEIITVSQINTAAVGVPIVPANTNREMCNLKKFLFSLDSVGFCFKTRKFIIKNVNNFLLTETNAIQNHISSD